MLKTGADRLWLMTMLCVAGGIAAAAGLPFVPLPAPASWPYIAASAAVHFVYQFLLVRTYDQGDFSQTYPIARGSAPMMVAVGGLVFAGEQLTAVEILGIAAVSGGIVALAFHNGRFHREAVPAALATGLSIALYSVIDGIGGRASGNALAYLMWMSVFWSGAILAAYAQRRGLRSLFARPRREIASASAAGLMALGGYGIIIWAMTLSPMGPVSALRETSVVFATLIARIFMAEQPNLYRILACLTVAAGAACLALS
jgi:drug/metabolite transporter (DMT)-like permease